VIFEVEDKLHLNLDISDDVWKRWKAV